MIVLVLALISNTELPAGQHCSRESNRKAKPGSAKRSEQSSTYLYVLRNVTPVSTSMYLSVLLTTILVPLGTSLYLLGTAWYLLVPLCTRAVHTGTDRYVL